MPSLPRYQQANIQAVAPTGGAGAKAAYQAQAQGASNLAQTLASFSNQMTQVGRGQVRIEAVADAKRDTFKRKQEIVDIRKNTKDPLEAEEKIKNIAEVQAKSNFGLYGQVYNNAAEAAYTNQVTLDIQNASRRALEESQGSPEAYKKLMQDFETNTVAYAPSKESAIIASQSFQEKGMSGYKTLALNKAKESKKYNDKINADVIQVRGDDYKNYFAKGNVVDAQNALDQVIEALKNDTTMTPIMKENTIKELREDAVVDKLKTDFLEAEKRGKGNNFINSIKNNKQVKDILPADKYNATWSYLKKQFKVAKTRTNTYAKLSVSDAIKTFNSGNVPRNMVQVEKQLQGLTPKQKKNYYVAKKVYYMSQSVQDKSLPEIEANVNQRIYQSRQEGNEEEAEVLFAASKIIKERKIAAQKDGVALANQEGIVPPTAAVVPGNATPLKEREVNSQVIVDKYGVGPAMLTNTEATTYADWSKDNTTTTESKVKELINITQNAGENSYVVFKEISKAGGENFSVAGGLVKQGKVNVAREIIKGQKIMKLEGDKVPVNLKYTAIDSLGNVFSHAEPDVKKNFTDAINAVYANIANDKGNYGSDDYDSDDMEAAVEKVTGGIYEYNDKKILAPKPGVTKGQFEDWLDDIDKEDVELPVGVENKKVLADLLEESQLESLGNGKYAATYNGLYLKNPNGSKYVLEYK